MHSFISFEISTCQFLKSCWTTHYLGRPVWQTFRNKMPAQALTPPARHKIFIVFRQRRTIETY